MIVYGRHKIFKKDLYAVNKTLKSNYLSTGPKIKQYENKICRYLNVKYASSCSSGTAGLHLAFIAAGIKKNDVVLLPVINFVAASNLLLNIGAKIFFCDVEKNSGLISSRTIQECIKKKKLKKIKAVVNSHLAGDVRNIKEIYTLKKKIGFILIDDACHALGTIYKYNNKIFKVGSCKHSDLSIFSTHPLKTITTGEGGFITTNKKVYFEKIEKIKSHGVVRKKFHFNYDVIYPGYNYRMSDINASLGISQFTQIEKFIKYRNKIANLYFSKFSRAKEITILDKGSNFRQSYHLLRIQINKFNKKKSEKLIKYMRRNKIFLQKHYIPIYKFSYYKKFLRLKEKQYPEAKYYFEKTLSLPIHLYCNNKIVDQVVYRILNFIKKNG